MIITIPHRYGVRGGTAANLATVNEVPLVRELIFETDTGKFKRGDGVTAYNALPYFGTGSVPEGTNLYHTAARVDARIAVYAPKGYIDGLQMQWVSGTALTVSSGSAYIEASGNIVAAPSAIAKTGLTLAASTWHHVYLYLNAGTPDIEIVTTAPVAYSGTARSKTGDTSRRYVGSVKTDAAGSIFNFYQASNYIGYKHDHGAAPFRVLSEGTATTETTVSLAAVVPVTSRMAQAYLLNLSNHLMGTGTSDDSAGGPPYAGIALVSDGVRIVVTHPLNSSQQMTYWLTTLGVALTGSAYIDVYGYHLER